MTAIRLAALNLQLVKQLASNHRWLIVQFPFFPLRLATNYVMVFLHVSTYETEPLGKNLQSFWLSLQLAQVDRWALCDFMSV